MALEVMYKTCCGLDVHKMKIVACLRKGQKREIKEFSATTREIKKMVEWLKANKCEMVAMESTSVYWKPLVNIFEMTEVEYMVINARDYKNVPGRKTDIQDSEWISDFLRHGLLRSSFIPTRAQRELREAVRYLKKMTEERARSLNRLQKLLEGANIKISSVVSEINGKTAMNLLDYVLNNDEDIDEDQAKKLIITRIKASVEEVVEAMEGIITPFQREMMKKVIKHIHWMTDELGELDEMVAKYMTGYEEALERLQTIPGIARTSAEIILAEIV
jgi:transposase